MKINDKEISKELIAKAMQCDTPEELVKVAKENGVDLTVKEAEAYMAEMDDVDLDREQLKKVAGGDAYTEAICSGVWNQCSQCGSNDSGTCVFAGR